LQCFYKVIAYLREQIALPSAIDADRLKEHHAALDALGQIANEIVGTADIPSFHKFIVLEIKNDSDLTVLPRPLSLSKSFRSTADYCIFSRTEIMSFDEIVEQVPKLTGEERDALRSYLDQYEAMENDAIDEGLRSLKEEPTITFEELDRRISEKFGWK
jgi:hypothetical protein